MRRSGVAQGTVVLQVEHVTQIQHGSDRDFLIDKSGLTIRRNCIK
jgi:hypothetical protein